MVTVKIIMAVAVFAETLFLTDANSSASYVPLKVGNSWTYTVFMNMNYCCKSKFTIVSDTVISGRKYFRSSASLPINHILPLNIRFYRMDSTSGNFLGFVNGTGCSYSPFEILIDSLSADTGNTSIACPAQNIRVCTDKAFFPAPWSQSYLRKRFQYKNGITQTPTAYFKDLGLAGSADGPLGEISFDIIGCVVNGVVYGDTTLTSVIQPVSYALDNFSLGQNYPNPFNPLTVINYSLFENRFISISVYDMLGNEVETLVRERKVSGQYEVEFDAEDLSSGAYFYTLSVDGKVRDTKRMLLLK